LKDEDLKIEQKFKETDGTKEQVELIRQNETSKPETTKDVTDKTPEVTNINYKNIIIGVACVILIGVIIYNYEYLYSLLPGNSGSTPGGGGGPAEPKTPDDFTNNNTPTDPVSPGNIWKGVEGKPPVIIEDVSTVTPEPENVSPATSTSSTDTVRPVSSLQEAVQEVGGVEKTNLDIQNENLDTFFPKEVKEEIRFFKDDNISSSFTDSFPKPTEQASRELDTILSQDKTPISSSYHAPYRKSSGA
jgi:hypothetical protein